MTETIAKKRVLSGMRPTGKLHLGNYMGALKNWVGLQNQVDAVTGELVYDCYFFIADLHALTTDYADPSQIKQNTVDVALDFLAAGLDPEKSTIFIQSHVKQHAELHLLFSMVTPLGWLERVPTYKEQQENIRGKDLGTYGFLGYPLLQSADILLYQPEYVPVGQDQVAHVELTREVARRFNSLYKTRFFPEPEALLTPTPKLPGTDGRKMSKSYGNTIGLSDTPTGVVSKVYGMSTNGQRLSQSDPGDPDLCPVGDLHKIFSSAEVIANTQAGCRQASAPCVWCKIEAGRSVESVTAPIHAKRQRLESEIDRTWEMLIEQSEKAAGRAEETMGPVRAALNISRDLGSVRRRFGWTATEQERRRDLSGQAEAWDLPVDLRSKMLRDYWRENLVPFDLPLRQEANRVFKSIERELEEPFLTNRKKRLFVSAPYEITSGNAWIFEVPLKTYEIWTLLVWHQSKWLDDFVIPQKYFIQGFAAWRAFYTNPAQLSDDTRAMFETYRPSSGEAKIPVRIYESEGNFTMLIHPLDQPVPINDLRGNYQPLQ